MKLFNHLRQRMVRKLIRPEDGYTYTGFSENQPIKFYYQEDTDKYLIGMRSGNWYYFEPTLTGWSAYASRYLPWGETVEDCEFNSVTKNMDPHTYNQEPKEVSFQKWMFGILSNLYEQYMERLSNISRKELNDFSDKKNGDKLMITKESFCDIMRALDTYWHDIDELERVLGVVFESNMLTKVMDSVLDAFTEELEPYRDFGEDSMIYHWMFELDAGRAAKAKEGMDGHALTTAEELYDYLAWKREIHPYEDEALSLDDED